MAYTLSDLEAITAAIATGALTVEYSDRKVVYRSLADMRSIKAEIEQALGLQDGAPRLTYWETRKGV